MMFRCAVFLGLLALASVSCSLDEESTSTTRSEAPATDAKAPEPAAPASPDASKNATSVEANGAPFGLTITASDVQFCDASGGKRLDPSTGRVDAMDRDCSAPTDLNTACEGIGVDAYVKAPGDEPSEIVVIEGTSFPLKGRVHDCASDGKLVVIQSTPGIVVIDHASESMTELERTSADRVAVGEGWIAWTSGSEVHVERVPPLSSLAQ